MTDFTQNLGKAIDRCPTPSHYISYCREVLNNAGYKELREDEQWESFPQRFYVTRDERQIIVINMKDFSSGTFVAAQDDASCFKAKPISCGSGAGCIQVRIAPYGPATSPGTSTSENWHLWADRDLVAAGRAIYRDGENVKSALFHTKKPIAVIPNLAIHMDRTSANKADLNLETRMNPILCLDDGEQQMSSAHSDALLEAIANDIGCKKEDIIDFDCCFVEEQKSAVIGMDKSLFAAPRLAQLSGAIAAVNNIAAAEIPKSGLQALVIYDSQLINGLTRCGVKSNFLKATLERIGAPPEFYAKSHLVAINPISGSNNKSLLGGGVVAIYTPNRASSVEMTAFYELKKYMEEKGIKLNAADVQLQLPIAKTCAPIMGFKGVDVGIPVYSISSPRQTAYLSDVECLNNFVGALFN